MAKAAHSDLLTDNNIALVISELNSSSPITKKRACEILGITYNTTRLQKIIQEYQDKQAAYAKRYKEKAGKPATDQEIVAIITGYLKDKEPIYKIAKTICRSEHFVKTVLEQAKIPLRNLGQSYWNVPLIPETYLKEEYEPGEICYSVRYQSLALIKDWHINKQDELVYCIWLTDEDWQQHAYQPWWELVSLNHLKQFGVSL